MIEQNSKVLREPDWDKVHKNYKEWIPKISLIPTVFYGIGLIVSLVTLIVMISSYKINGWIILPVAILNLCISEIAKREGHREGYLYGYSDGYDQGRDDVLGEK